MALVEDTLEVDEELLGVFLEDAEEELTEVDCLMERLDCDPDDGAAVQAVFRIVHTIKGVAGFIPASDVVTLTHGMETTLDALRKRELRVDAAILRALLRGFDLLHEMLGRLRDGPHSAQVERPTITAVLEDLGRAHTAATRELTTAGEHPGYSEEPPIGGTSRPPSRSAPDASSSNQGAVPCGTGTSRTMRVDEERIDEFLAYVSEFIVLRETFDHVGKRLRADLGATPAMKDFERARRSLVDLSGDLQRSIMSVRRVPAKGLLRKVPRIVREVAGATGKRVDLVMEGEEVRLDKSLIQSIEGPLVHIVRNAIDHGIEDSAVRRQRGKPERASLRVELRATAGEARLSVSDDGGGVDAAALREKALKMGLITRERALELSDEESYPLLFSPGLSTAKQLTDISGRGVGMDVVHSAVTGAGGRIEIATTAGVGTTFTICLPTSVTVKIVEGFVVRVAGQVYVLPLEAVHECFSVSSARGPEPSGGQLVVQRGNRLVSVCPLQALLSQTRCGIRDRQPVVVIRLDQTLLVGLGVDAILGMQQVVLREVPYLESFETPFCGAVVLGDGRIALMLDVDGIAQCLQGHPSDQTVAGCQDAA